MSGPELKPCPFCGGAGYQHKHFWAVVTCGTCAADGPAGDTEAEAITAWNARATGTVSADAGERVTV